MPDTSSIMLTAVLIINLLLYTVFGFFLPMGLAHFAATGNFIAAFSLSPIVQSIKAVLQQYLGVLFLFVVLCVALSFLSEIPIVGLVLLVLLYFYVHIATSLLFGELYRRSQAMLGQ